MFSKNGKGQNNIWKQNRVFVTVISHSVVYIEEIKQPVEGNMSLKNKLISLLKLDIVDLGVKSNKVEWFQDVSRIVRKKTEKLARRILSTGYFEVISHG